VPSASLRPRGPVIAARVWKAAHKSMITRGCRRRDTITRGCRRRDTITRGWRRPGAITRASWGLGLPVLLACVVTASAPGLTTYHIKRGDTLTHIAKRYHVSVAQLIAANDLPGNGNLIFAGQSLSIPSRAAPSSSGRGRVRLVAHRVGLGDTLSEIAERYHVPQRAIARANGLRGSFVVLGSTLRIPVREPRAGTARKLRATSKNSFAGRTYPPAVIKAASRNRAILSRRDLPDRDTTRRMIVRTARAYGVNPELALAVAWQESGWSQRHVSVANAIGVMQVLPSTGRWISTVVGRELNLLNTRDNIIAGVALLKVLSSAAEPERAVAGYYQGLGSVQRHGMFRDTKRYVRSVLALEKRFENG
jgi:N-acetylmuramoyl-L-alanine amidase